MSAFESPKGPKAVRQYFMVTSIHHLTESAILNLRGVEGVSTDLAVEVSSGSTRSPAMTCTVESGGFVGVKQGDVVEMYITPSTLSLSDVRSIHSEKSGQ